MLLIAIGSTTSGSRPYYPCDDFIIENYWYRNNSKVMYYGISKKSGNWGCYRSVGYETVQKAITEGKKYCQENASNCTIMAINNTIYGPSAYRNSDRQDNKQNYTGENKVCNSSVPGGCAGAFKP